MPAQAGDGVELHAIVGQEEIVDDIAAAELDFDGTVDGDIDGSAGVFCPVIVLAVGIVEILAERIGLADVVVDSGDSFVVWKKSRPIDAGVSATGPETPMLQKPFMGPELLDKMREVIASPLDRNKAPAAS